jgi:hypothetical protein
MMAMVSVALQEQTQRQIPPAPLLQRGEKQARMLQTAAVCAIHRNRRATSKKQARIVQAAARRLPPLKKGVDVCAAGGGGICLQQQYALAFGASTTNTREALTS